MLPISTPMPSGGPRIPSLRYAIEPCPWPWLDPIPMYILHVHWRFVTRREGGVGGNQWYGVPQAREKPIKSRRPERMLGVKVLIFLKRGEGRDTESRKKMKRKSPHATHLQMTSGGRMLGWHPFCRGKILIVNHNDVEQSVLVLVG